MDPRAGDRPDHPALRLLVEGESVQVLAETEGAKLLVTIAARRHDRRPGRPRIGYDGLRRIQFDVERTRPATLVIVPESATNSRRFWRSRPNATTRSPGHWPTSDAASRRPAEPDRARALRDASSAIFDQQPVLDRPRQPDAVAALELPRPPRSRGSRTATRWPPSSVSSYLVFGPEVQHLPDRRVDRVCARRHGVPRRPRSASAPGG